METGIPRALRIRPMEAAVMPLPSELVTPPVTKTYFGIGLVIPPGFFRFYQRPMVANAAEPITPVCGRSAQLAAEDLQPALRADHLAGGNQLQARVAEQLPLSLDTAPQAGDRAPQAARAG